MSQPNSVKQRVIDIVTGREPSEPKGFLVGETPLPPWVKPYIKFKMAMSPYLPGSIYPVRGYKRNPTDPNPLPKIVL